VIADRLARALVRRYPRAWRERYERELLALFEDAPPTVLHVVDLAFGCLAEWGRTLRARRQPRPVLVPLACVAAVRIASMTMDACLGVAPPAWRMPLVLAWSTITWVVLVRATPAFAWGPARPRLRMSETEALVMWSAVLVIAIVTDWVDPLKVDPAEGAWQAVPASIYVPVMTFNMLTAIQSASPLNPTALRRRLHRPPPTRPLGL
jgi:hypothetical protein